MNTRSHVIDLTCEEWQVEEAVSSIFHTVLFHRCQGKFKYTTSGNSYSMGTVGFTDIDCDFIEFNYVSVASETLRQTIKSEVSIFTEKLRNDERTTKGQISLEFFQRKKQWIFGALKCVPWEIWTVQIEIVNHDNEYDRQISRERLGDALSEKLCYISKVMYQYDYVPRVPLENDLDCVYNTQIPDIQLYLFKIYHSISGESIPSKGDTIRDSFGKLYQLFFLP